MSDDRKRILGMVAAGKLSTEEAEQLLDALDKKEGNNGTVVTDAVQPGVKKNLKFLRVDIRSTTGDNVNVRVPMALLRAGLKLSSLIPPLAYAKVNEKMSEHGMTFDLNNLKPADIEQLIESMGDLDVNINSANGDTVKVFCE
jgi:hypothetical protein